MTRSTGASWPLLFMLFGCGDEPLPDLIGSEPFSEHLPPEMNGQAPPPARPLVFDADDFYLGNIATMRAQGAQPGERVFFGGSVAGEGPGLCPPTLGGNCLGILRPFLIGSAITDANGLATFTVNLPSTIPYDSICLQSAVLDSSNPALSNVYCAPIENPVGEGPAVLTNGGGTQTSARFTNVVTIGDPIAVQQISSSRFSMSVGVNTLTPVP